MIVIKRRSVIIVGVLVLSILTFFICLFSLNVKQLSNTESRKIKIVLDAGHGGIDNGVSGISTGVKESELNLKVVNKLKGYFVDAGFNVTLTRNSENGLYSSSAGNFKKQDMTKRREIILQSEPTLVISVHMNYFPVSKRRGGQVFYKKGDNISKTLASEIQKNFNQLKNATKDFSPLSGDYYILNCSGIPSVICECGFLSNVEDEKLLITEEFQSEVSYAIFKGVVSYLSIESIKYF